jgi:protoporphyrinogen oxidase
MKNKAFMTGGQKTAVIIGAGPAGLTAAYELVEKTDIKPIIYEMTDYIGGIARTVDYKGNRIDIGGHRFFSKSDRIMQWWLNILPLQGAPSRDDVILKRQIPLSGETNAPDPEKRDLVMLVRHRISRIFFLRKFFDYPVKLGLKTIFGLGIKRIFKIFASYVKIRIAPIKEEKNMEDFFVNRFGKELYLTFFKDYTEKIWGVPCRELSAEWGAQRIKGLSIAKAISNAFRRIIFMDDSSISQKNVETSLIEQFLYPKLGPGQLWQEVAKIVKEKGAEIYLNHRVTGVKYQDNMITEVEVRNEIEGRTFAVRGDYFFSTMPIKDLMAGFRGSVPEDARRIAQGLKYRDFIIVGLLLNKLKIMNETRIKTINNIIPDNWVYIQEKDVKLGRVQVFNNWSPYLVKDEGKVWMGLEYFCDEGDWLWNKSDEDFSNFAIDELVKIGFIEQKEDILDSVVIRMPKTYPAYSGSFKDFNIIRNFTDRFENLFLIGRNGMHRYNNTDHSMLTAMVAVENIINGIKSKDNIWAVNIERQYHEERQ